MHQRLSRLTLFILSLLTAAALYLASQLGFDYNFENFFPQDDPETEYYKYFRDRFETDNDFVVIGLLNDEGIFDYDFLRRTDSLTKELRKIDHVEQVLSPTELPEIIRDPLLGQIFTRKLLRWEEPENYSADSIRIFNRKELVGSLFSVDGKALLLQLRQKEFLHKEGCDSLAMNIKQALARAGFDQAYAVGRAIGQEYYIHLMQTELVIFVSLSIVLVIAFLFIAFRSFWGVWLPILVVLLSILWTLAFMKICGKQIDLMLTILPTILFVVGMSDVVHIITRYFEALRAGETKVPALMSTFKEVGLATFLTSLTTAVGFLTLISAPIKPIQEFGIYAAVGVLIAYILAFTLLPAVLLLISPPKHSKINRGSFAWNRILHSSFLWILHNQRKIIVISVVISVISLVGISFLKVNNYLLEDLKEGDALREEFDFFADKFAGARPFEMSVRITDSSRSVIDSKVLSELDRIGEYLERQYGVGNIISPATLMKSAHRTWMGGSEEYFRLPEDSSLSKLLWKTLQRKPLNETLRLFVNEEDNLLRITGKVADEGSAVFIAKNEEFYRWASHALEPGILEIQITGTAHLIDNNNKALSINLLSGLGVAFLVIALIAGLMFRSFKMIVVALIPNILPLLMIGGTIGFLGVDIKVSTSIIFTIAFGIAVDDTIHLLSKLRLQLREGKSLLYALKRSYISAGKAIIVTSLILCGGFLTLIASDFLSTFYVGLFISLTLLFALIADLFLLPVLILWFFGKKGLMAKS
jgi:predicted RND superfamily exporter protein